MFKVPARTLIRALYLLMYSISSAVFIACVPQFRAIVVESPTPAAAGVATAIIIGIYLTDKKILAVIDAEDQRR